MKLRDYLQKSIGKMTNKHCCNCKYEFKNDRCTRLDTIGFLCRKGIYPLGYNNKKE